MNYKRFIIIMFSVVVGAMVISSILAMMVDTSDDDLKSEIDELNSDSYECTDESVKAIKQMYHEMLVVNKEMNILKGQIKDLEVELQTQAVLCSGAFVENTLKNIMKEENYVIEGSSE